MRSLCFKTITLGVAFALAGCLVSEEPVLDERTGKARPLGVGAYEMCPVSNDADEDDCEQFTISVDATGLYRFQSDDEEDDASYLRFRRIARDAYAVQTGEDDGYMYYFGRGDADHFELLMMLCASLSEKTRDRLIDNGDLSSDDDDFETCAVNTLAGLRVAALDYHRGRASDVDETALVFTPIATP